MKRELILYYYPNKKFSIKKDEIRTLKKKYSKISLFRNLNKYNTLNFTKNDLKLDKIRKKYIKLGIHLNIKKIYEINTFLKSKRFRNKNKIFVSPYFIYNTFLEEDYIFYELSKIYKIQFLRPELSFIRNRFLLAKDIYKQPYSLKVKTYYSKKDYRLFKTNYILSIQKYSETIQNKESKFLYKIFMKFFSFLLNFRFNERPKKYILLIFQNNTFFRKISHIVNLRSLVNLITKKFKYEVVFLLHPTTDPFIYFLKKIKNREFFFRNKSIIFYHQPKNLIELIQNSKFIIHTSSSLSAQTLIFNKKILCLGERNFYIKNLKNVIWDFKQNYFHNLKKKLNKKDILKINKFLKNYLSNTINSKGEFQLYTNKKDYTSFTRSKFTNKYDKKIIQNLLNAI